ncbi:MAG: hypothetical protein LCI00_05460 [Chloroflexi bacterium]|nr:hypothetical protein [Chloroflexota bacterium]
MPQTESSIVVNCQRTHSNLLRIDVGTDGLYLFFLNVPTLHATPEIVGMGEFLSFADYPAFRDIRTVYTFDTVWDEDMLCAISTLHEDYSITLAGVAAVQQDELWEPEREPDFVNPTNWRQGVA